VTKSAASHVDQRAPPRDTRRNSGQIGRWSMRRTAEAEAFGGLVRQLRGARSQVDFARTLGISRSLIANTEVGRECGPLLPAALVQAFPSRGREIEAAHQAAVAAQPTRPGPRQRRLSAPQHPLLRRMRTLRSNGRQTEARFGLQRALRELTATSDLLDAWQELAEVHTSLGDEARAIEAYESAIAVAEDAGLVMEVVRIQNRWAGLLMRNDRFEAALAVVENGLCDTPRDPLLWRRKGVVQWYAHRFSDAYASLTTARDCGFPKLRVFHARGQVLAEWGRYDQAIEELTMVIETAPYVAQAYARSGRAYAYGGVGQFDLALREFAGAEAVAPENSWLHYLRARCYDEMGEIERAAAGFSMALMVGAPPLNKPKREFALERISSYERECS
jgi:tetratricopeptide (TPR) repeat protein